MSYKKFTVGTTETKKENTEIPTENKIIESVTPIEIGDDITLEVYTAKNGSKKRAKKPFAAACAVFVCVCVLSASVFAVMPLPSALRNILVVMAGFAGGEKQIPTEEPPEYIPDYEKDSAYSVSEPETDTAITDIIKSEPADFSYSNMTSLSNETEYSVDIAALLAEKYPIDAIPSGSYKDDAVEVFAQKAPEVLIIHTHGTECYSDAQTENYRSPDKSLNVVSVGRALSDKLTQSGVSVLHCEEMFDEKSYIKAYSNSFSAVNEYLSEYPTIKYVIDLHRDAVSDGNGGYKRLCADIDSKSAAQMMFVIGTDQAGASHKDWHKNLRTALGIQQAVCEKHPNLMRPLNLRKASFNQQLSPGYFILEVGNCGNSVSEAIYAVEIFGEIFAELITA